MTPVLERCDREGERVYLESSKEQNIPFCNRHGFEVTEEIRVPRGPAVWAMWRHPRRRAPVAPAPFDNALLADQI